MKLPKGWNKMTDIEQRQWVADKLREVRALESKLVKISRELVYGKLIVSDGTEDRPDVVLLKEEK